jgi:hypothetical protein
MRMRGILLLSVFFLSGCALLNPPRLYSPRTVVGQNLLYEASAAACDASRFIPRDSDIGALEKSLKVYQAERDEVVNDRRRWTGEQEALSQVRELEYNIVTLKSKLGQLRSAMDVISRYEKPKYCLDIRMDKEKKKIFQYMLETAVRNNGIDLASGENEAAFKFVVNVNQYDIKYSKFGIFLYSYTVTRAVAAIDVNLVEIKTGKTFFKGGSKCEAYQKEYQVLGVGPFRYRKTLIPRTGS